MGVTVKLDHAGIAAILASSKVAAQVHGLAETIASGAEVDAHDGPVEVLVEDYRAKLKRDTTTRAASAVTLAHPAGLGLEARYGTLTRAARAAGVEVKSRKAAK